MQVNIQLSKLKRPRKKEKYEKAQQTLYGLKTIHPGTQGGKNKALKRPIDLTGIIKVPIVS